MRKEGEEVDSFKEDIRKTAQEIIEKLILIDLYGEKRIDEKDKERIEEILKKSEEKEEIVEFLSLEEHKLYGDFVIIIMKQTRLLFFGLKIRNSEMAIERHRKRQKELRMIFNGRFIESLVIVVNPQKSDEELRRDWQKILKQIKES